MTSLENMVEIVDLAARMNLLKRDSFGILPYNDKKGLGPLGVSFVTPNRNISILAVFEHSDTASVTLIRADRVDIVDSITISPSTDPFALSDWISARR